MVKFTELPPEILHSILTYIDPLDLPSISLLNQQAYQFVRGNNALCQAIYLQHLDEPPPGTAMNWEQDLHDFGRLRRICSSKDPDKSQLGFVHDTATRLLARSTRAGGRLSHSITYPASRNAAILTGLFAREAAREAFLCQSFLFERARNLTNRFANPSKPEHQQSAKLHCLHGVPVLHYGRTRAGYMAPLALSKVYDLRQYTQATHWGPFMGDGSDRVDWERVEAIILVLLHNMRDKRLQRFPVFANFWETPFAGSWPGSYLPMPTNREVTSVEMSDPYDVSGTWLRMLCFLDYNDFWEYNFPDDDQLPAHVPRPALDRGEAARLILMKIHVTKIEPPGPEDGQELPVVHFRGFSRGLDSRWDESGDSDIQGYCRLTREGEVRWSTWSTFSGQARWRSEGVQLGGVRAARGVVGNWFDKDYDPNGPCGPNAFWKISDREPNSNDEEILLNDFLPIVDGYDDIEAETIDEGEEDGSYEDELQLELEAPLPDGVQLQFFNPMLASPEHAEPEDDPE